MSLTVYAAMNWLFALAYFVSVPSYALRQFTDRRGVLTQAGSLLQKIWYPNVVELEVGESGLGRYVPGTQQQVLRGACVPCPLAVVQASDPSISVTYGVIGSLNNADRPQYPENPYYEAPLKASRKQCVRTGFLGEPGNVIVKGPRSMQAKEYLAYQFFGPGYMNTYTDLYGASSLDKVTVGPNLANVQAKLAGRWNRALFGDNCPFPSASATVLNNDNDYQHPGDVVKTGWFRVNNKSLIPPKLWQRRGREDGASQQDANKALSVTSCPWREDTNQPDLTKVYPNYSRQGYGDYPNYSHWADQYDLIRYWLNRGNTRKNSSAPKINFNQDAQEIEWWYVPVDWDKDQENAQTHFGAWTEDQCRHYVANFFAGGGDIIATYVS